VKFTHEAPAANRRERGKKHAESPNFWGKRTHLTSLRGDKQGSKWGGGSCRSGKLLRNNLEGDKLWNMASSKTEPKEKPPLKKRKKEKTIGVKAQYERGGCFGLV